MNPPPRPSLKSLPAHPTGTGPAEPGPAPAGRGAPKVVGRKAVPSSRHSDPRTVTVSGITPGLHIRGLGKTGFPTADWLCTCGHHERARGRKAVTALMNRVRVGHCPHRPARPNRTQSRSAA
ncbi:hypothetical protein ABT218_12585 [Streptomyces sp. NPDC001455]|uniref:hypothetical protein n=1 Tax=Streptomyces sp. NPDC001455 TaxID=3154518 RepID=UPI003318F39C